MTHSSAHPPQHDTDFVITRYFDAPRELVYRAWTDPEMMARWFGPKVFTNPDCQLDVRPGGEFRIVMRSPEGVDYPFKGVYLEVEPPKRLVYTNDCSEHGEEWLDLVVPDRDKTLAKPFPDPITEVTFEQLDGQTKLTVRMTFDTARLRDAFVRTGMNEGWSESFETLTDLLAKR